MSRAIPYELVQALMSHPANPAFALYVGELPPEFPSDLAPKQTGRLVGGMTTEGATSAVFALPRDAGNALELLRTRLAQMGYSSLSDAADTGSLHPNFGFLRKGRRQVTMTQIDGESGEVLLKLSVTDYAEPIADHREPRGRMGRFGGLEIPRLTPPAGARSRGAGGGGSGNSQHTHNELETQLTPSVVLEHYATQLKAAGWALLESTSAGDRVMQWVEADDADGIRWRGLVSAFRNDTLVSVHVYVVTPSAPAISGRIPMSGTSSWGELREIKGTPPASRDKRQ